MNLDMTVQVRIVDKPMKTQPEPRPFVTVTIRNADGDVLNCTTADARPAGNLVCSFTFPVELKDDVIAAISEVGLEKVRPIRDADGNLIVEK